MSTNEPHLMLAPRELQGLTLGQLTELEEQTSQTCEICNKFFKKISHFNRHMREKHTQERDYVCKEEGCTKTFKRGSHLKRHMISHSSVKSFKCGNCIMSFGYKHHLDRHVKVIHLSQRLECVECNLKFIKRKAYNKHIQKMHTQRIPKEKKERSGDEEKHQDHYTITKIGLDQSRKEEIYDSSNSESQEELCAKSERELYRCHHDSCISAFYGLYEFKRHLKKVHSMNDK